MSKSNYVCAGLPALAITTSVAVQAQATSSTFIGSAATTAVSTTTGVETVTSYPTASVDHPGGPKLPEVDTPDAANTGENATQPESAPDFKQKRTEMSALRDQLARAEKEELASSGDSYYIAKFRDFKYYEALFDLFAKQYEMARIDESCEGAGIQVVDAAQSPERKSKPKKALIAMMTTLAVGFTLLRCFFIRQALRGTIQTPESAEKLARLRHATASSFGRT